MRLPPQSRLQKTCGLWLRKTHSQNKSFVHCKIHDTLFQAQSTLDVCVRAQNSNANPLMLLASSVDTPIHINRFFCLLCACASSVD